MANHSNILVGKSHGQEAWWATVSPWGWKELGHDLGDLACMWVTKKIFIFSLKYQMMGQIIKLLKRFKINQDLKEKKSFQEKKKIGEAFATGRFISRYTYFSRVFPTPASLYLCHVDSLC